MATALTRNSWKSTVERETKKKKKKKKKGKEGEKQKIPMNFERRIAVGNANAERRRKENDCGGRLEMKRESRKERSFGTVSHNGRYFFFPPPLFPLFPSPQEEEYERNCQQKYPRGEVGIELKS